jgi:hypothetical protein
MDRIRPLLPVLRPIIAIALIALLARHVDFGGAARVLAQVPPAAALLALGLFGVGQALSTLRWRIALAQFAGLPPAFGRLLRIYLIGMFVNLGLPTMAGGDVVRAEMLRRLIRSRGGAYASILADRLIGVVAVVTLAGLAAFAAGAQLETGLRHFAVLTLVAVTGLALGLVLLARARRLWPRHLRLDAFAGALAALAARPRVLALCLGIALAVQVVAVILPIAILARAMGIDLPFAVHAMLVPVIVLVTLLPLAPGGIGLRETAFVVLYARFGVPADSAFALGAAWSVILLAYGLVGGLALLRGRAARGNAGRA